MSLPLWGKAVKTHRERERNDSHSYYGKINVTLGHRSGLLQTVGSHLIKKTKLNKKGNCGQVKSAIFI